MKTTRWLRSSEQTLEGFAIAELLSAGARRLHTCLFPMPDGQILTSGSHRQLLFNAFLLSALRSRVSEFLPFSITARNRNYKTKNEVRVELTLKTESIG